MTAPTQQYTSLPLEDRPPATAGSEGNCTVCDVCYGKEPSFGLVVKTWCGRESLFDHWVDSDEPDCEACTRVPACPVCGVRRTWS